MQLENFFEAFFEASNFFRLLASHTTNMVRPAIALLMLPALANCAAGADEWTIVPGINSVPSATKGHSVMHLIDSLDACRSGCENNATCKVFSWNYGHPEKYCFWSFDAVWVDTPNDHIISGCRRTGPDAVKKCPPPPPPTPPPTSAPPTPAPPPLPYWTGPTPNVSKPAAGYQQLANVKHTIVWDGDNTTWGSYNHGPIITWHPDTQYVVNWYNGYHGESHNNRCVYATSDDGQEWSEPAVSFNTSGKIGLESESFVNIAGRLYLSASSWDVNQRTGGGAEHKGPDVLLMRRLRGKAKSDLG
jgi:hypothetical protein